MTYSLTFQTHFIITVDDVCTKDKIERKTDAYCDSYKGSKTSICRGRNWHCMCPDMCQGITPEYNDESGMIK